MTLIQDQNVNTQNAVDIIPTIQPHPEKQFMEDIEYAIACGINKLRFNFSKCKNKEDVTYFVDLIKSVETNNCDINCIVDLPYPRKRNRVFFGGKEKKILKNQTYFLDISQEEEQDVKNENLNKFIFYGDGQGAFKVDKVIGRSQLQLTALNDFNFFSSKAFGNHLKPGSEELYVFLKEILGSYDLMLSFVENKNDIERLAVEHKGYIYSKIENQEGINNLDSILEVTDGVIIARGDLGIQANIYDLYNIQKIMAYKCRKKKVPFYIATDILESLNKRYIPSRADIIDLSVLLRLEPTGLILNYCHICNRTLERCVEIINSTNNYIL